MTQCPKHNHWSYESDCWQCFKESNSTAFDITSDFIEEQRKAADKIQGTNIVKPSKFSPYTRAEREERRKEVARLHFEKGMPGIRIAEAMKVDKNTIYSDLRAIYRELARPGNSTAEAYDRFYVRLEMQRARLEDYLSKENDIQTKLMIERQLADIESKLLRAEERIYDNANKIRSAVADQINKYCEENKLDYRVLNLQELLKISSGGWKSFMTVLRKERIIA